MLGEDDDFVPEVNGTRLALLLLCLVASLYGLLAFWIGR